MARKVNRGFLSDMQNSECEKKSRKLNFLFLPDGADEIFRGFFGKPLQGRDIAFFKGKNIRRILDKSLIDEAVNDFRPEPLDIERVF